MKKCKSAVSIAKVTPKLLISFLRDYEISPSLISKQKSLQMLDILVQPDNDLKVFVDI